ncbi:MAG: T9SS type A sorting domain-containing protein [Chitinophagaceae bacterium]
MKQFYMLVLLVSVLSTGRAQLLKWNTFGNTGLETSEPSVYHHPDISASSLTLGAGITPASSSNRFGGSSWRDAGNANPNTLAEAIAGNDYIEFIVTPNSGVNYTVTSFIFLWQSSATGPRNLTLRSSADGFTANLATVSFSSPTLASHTMNISGLSNQSAAITFRLYGYGATSFAGTGGFNEFFNDVNVELKGYVNSGGQARHYRSVNTGDWTSLSSWESSADGINWTAAATIPDAATANIITIRTGHTISLESSTFADELVIEPGAQLTLGNGAAFALEDGPGTDLECQGTLLNAAGFTQSISGTLHLAAGATYIHNTEQDPTEVYFKTTIDPNSTWIYRGSPSLIIYPFVDNCTFGNLQFESSSGNYSFAPAIPGSNTCHVKDLYIAPGVSFDYSGLGAASRWTIDGNLDAAGTITGEDAGSFNATFTGSGKTISASAILPVHNVVFSNLSSYSLNTDIKLKSLVPATIFTISPGAILDANTHSMTGNGAAQISGQLITAHAGGLGGTFTNVNATPAIVVDPASTIEYNSAGPQQFNSPYGIQYGDVIISGGGAKTVTETATITGQVYLADGLVYLNADVLLTNPVYPSVPLFSTFSYFVTNGAGTLKHAVQRSGNYIFPVGSVSALQVVWINFPAALSAPNQLSARFIPGAPGDNGLPLAETGDNISHAAGTGYWRITAASPMTDLYTATFEAQSFSNISDYTKLHLLKRANGSSPWILDGTHVATTGSNSLAVLKRTGMSSFSEFAVGGEPGVSLPVTFTSFSGYRNGNINNLSWTTGTEINNQGFEVQRSTDGVNFTAIGFVNSQATGGNSSSLLRYTFTDNNPTGDKQYYRLRQEDFSGVNRLSQVILLRNGTNAAAITSLYPNPASSLLNIMITVPRRQELTLIVTDMAGKTVHSKSLVAETGSNTMMLEVGGLSKGTYLLRLSGTDGLLPGMTTFIKN